MIAEHFQILCDYNYWAHHQLWDCALQLSEEQFASKENILGLSVHEQMVNMASAEWLWTARLRGTSPTHHLTVAMLPDRDAIRKRWDAVEADLRDYVRNIRDSQLGEIIAYTTTWGEPQRNARWEILAYLFQRGTDYRARAAVTLLQMGVQPPEIELLHYFRDNEQHRLRIALERFHRQAPI